MEDCIKEKIVKNVVASVRSVKHGNGYQNDIPHLSVRRGQMAVDTNVIPLLLVYEGEEIVTGREYAAVPVVMKDLPVIVEIWFADFNKDNLYEELNSLEADVIKAVMSDNNRGGYAMETKQGSSPYAGQENKPIGGRGITFVVSYQVNEEDPYSQ